MSYSFRDKPRTRLSDRIRGKSGDELLQELRQEFDKDRKTFFDSNPNWGFTPAGSAFPRRHMFEDDVDDGLRSHGRGRTDLRAHLDDLARRHPEFAESLLSPPGWISDIHPTSSGSSGNSGKFQGSFGQSPNQESGFFEKSENNSINNNNNFQQPGNIEKPSENQQTNSAGDSQDSKVIGAEPPTRGRDSLSQHSLRNTDPDIGIKGQAAVKEDRNQRSMSAPPDGNRFNKKPERFVSKIEINPVNPATGETAASNDSGKPPMAPPKQQQSQQGTLPQQQKQSNVRHIPIFVEGRDEPVLPKNIDPEFVTSSRTGQQFSPPPSNQQFHSQQQFYPQQNQQKFNQQQPQRNSNQQQPNPQQHHPQFSQQQQKPANKAEENVQQNSQPQSEKKPKFNNDPMYQIEMVQKEVDELRLNINDFKGNSRTDKEYIYLDEMLTRNLIKLDIIETDGKDNIRTARRETIKSIQQCINLLESKVPQTPAVENPPSNFENSENKMDVDNNDSSNMKENEPLQDIEQNPQQTMEVEQQTNDSGVNKTDSANKESNVVSDGQNQQNPDSKNLSTDQTTDLNKPEEVKKDVNPNEISC